MKKSEGSAAAQTAIELSKLLFEFGQIKRVTKMPNGEQESDSHHSFTLALIGYELAKQFAPELDAMKVMAYGLAHDLPELVTGDVNTVLSTADELAQKYTNENASRSKVAGLFAPAPNIMELMARYEAHADEESKFIFWLDKSMSGLAHLFDRGKTLRELGAKDRAAIEQWYERVLQKLNSRAPNPHATAAEVLESLCQKMLAECFPAEAAAEVV